MINSMNYIKKSRVVKTLTGVGLCLSIAFSGSVLLPSPQVHAAAASSSSVADSVIATGKQFLGVPYQFGASSGRTNAFDCSSFTQYVFKQNGIDLPRSSREQSQVGTPVSKDQLQPGDLVFSDTNHDGVINHVSIYIGNGQLLHTYRVGIGVTISDFAGSAWDKSFVSARRVIPDNGQAPAASQPSDTKSSDATTTGTQATKSQSSDSNSTDSQVSNSQRHTTHVTYTSHNDKPKHYSGHTRSHRED